MKAASLFSEVPFLTAGSSTTRRVVFQKQYTNAIAGNASSAAFRCGHGHGDGHGRGTTAWLLQRLGKRANSVSFAAAAAAAAAALPAADANADADSPPASYADEGTNERPA